MDRWPAFSDPLSAVWNLPDRTASTPGDWTPDHRRTFAIVTCEPDALIGRLTLRDITTQRTSARLGITIGSPYVSQGYGTEALMLFLDTFFRVMRFQAMLLDVAALNERAVRCYRRLGFEVTNQQWRDGGSRFIERLPEATVQQITPFIRQGRHTVWVQFYDMRLQRAAWASRVHRRTASFT